VAPNTIYRYESGERKPSVAMLTKIARELRTEPAEFLREPVPFSEAPREAGPPSVVRPPDFEEWLNEHGAGRILMTDEEAVENFKRLAAGSKRQAIPERFEQEWNKAGEEEGKVTTALRKEWLHAGALFQEALEGLEGFERISFRAKEYERLRREISRQYQRYRRGLESFNRSLYDSGKADDFIFSSRSPQTAEAVRASVRALQEEAYENARGA
jgi:transcriptional regulator with XRE-family HTH domain